MKTTKLGWKEGKRERYREKERRRRDEEKEITNE
jgi:hypothetical protein